MFRQLQVGRAFLTHYTHTRTTAGCPFGHGHTFTPMYWHKILGRVLESSITPRKYVHTDILTDIPGSLPACQGSSTHTHMPTFTRTKPPTAPPPTHTQIRGWLESCACLTNGAVFIFCLWHGCSNDSIIVLSAQHSLPISFQNSSAAGYPRLCNQKKKKRRLTVTKIHLQQWLMRVMRRMHLCAVCSELPSSAQTFAPWFDVIRPRM